MPLPAICQGVRSHWQALTQLVWPESVAQQTQAEVRRLTGELTRRYQRLVRRRCKIEQVRDRLAEQERRMAELSGQVRSGGDRAWELALSLERLHRAVARHRERLQRHEQAYTRQREVLEQKKRLRLELMRGQVVVAGERDVG